MSWPKQIPVLHPELARKKLDWEVYWLNLHPNNKRYSFVDRFTRDFIKKFSTLGNCRTLEIGPGPNASIRYLQVDPKDYYVVERNSLFCQELRQIIPANNIYNQDISLALDAPRASFERIISAHVFEHLPDLPPVLRALRDLLTPDGHMDVVLPCEGGLLYTIGRKFSSAREYKRRFGAGFYEIMKTEHINTIFEIFDEIKRHFKVVESSCFPLPMPASFLGFHTNLLVAMRLQKGTDSR